MVILGHAGLLRRRADLAPIHENLDAIESQATRAGNMTRALLDFARRRARNPQTVHIRDIVERALTLVGEKRHGDAIETVLLFDESDPCVFGDRDELTQVFINLIGNALDAMPDGGRLTISSDVRRHDDMTYLSARVSDTGIGIPAEHRERIFESFFTTKPEGKGTGLGLAVTLEIVKNHEGTLEVESIPGKGTTMIVNLPLASDQLTASSRTGAARCR
jgi:signal transduction histidine kinase